MVLSSLDTGPSLLLCPHLSWYIGTNLHLTISLTIDYRVFPNKLKYYT
jgi:hypothetical protein